MRERAHTAVPAAVAQLSVKNVTKSYGTRTVLDQVSFTVRPGDRAAVIGENGSGKSTLLRLLAAAEEPDTGEVTVGFPGGTGHLAQTLDLDPHRTVQDAVDLALAELRDMERRLRTAEERLGGATQDELSAYGELLIAYEERGGYEADARVDAAMHGLGLAGITRDRALGSLSGGEQSRLALACVLAAAPELLLLDEPTNHLDAPAVRWLEEHLRAHRGTVVAVTHDRGFLERIATTILEVDRDARTVHRYGDGWAGYRAAKASARRRAEQEHADWLEEVARTEELLDAAGKRLATTGKDPRQGFGKHRRSHEAKLGGQVRSARERLAHLRRNPVAAPPEPLRFTAELPAAGGARPVEGPAPSARPGPSGERPWPSSTAWAWGNGCVWTVSSRSRRGSGCSSPARTGPARRRCCAYWRATWSPTPARYAVRSGSATWRRSCPRAPRGSRCSPPSRPGGPGCRRSTPNSCWHWGCSVRTTCASRSRRSPRGSSGDCSSPGW